MATQIWVKIGLRYGLVARRLQAIGSIDGLTHWHLSDLNKILNELFKANIID